MVLQQDFKERHAAAFMITKIRSFKRETIFFGGGGGGGGLFVVLYGSNYADDKRQKLCTLRQ